MNCSHGVFANFFEGGSADLTWWPELTWPGSKNFTECWQWMSLKKKKSSAHYLQPFGTRKTWAGASTPPPSPAKNRVNGQVASVISSRLRNFSDLGPIGLPDFGKSFKIIVEPGFSHEFDHAEFNGAPPPQKKTDPKISRGRYFDLKIWIFPYF